MSPWAATTIFPFTRACLRKEACKRTALQLNAEAAEVRTTLSESFGTNRQSFLVLK